MAGKSPNNSTPIQAAHTTIVDPETGELAEITDAEELYQGWETWEKLISRVQRKVLLWIPKSIDTQEIREAYAIDYEMPRTVYGRLIDITEIDGQYGRYRLLILEPPLGSPLARAYDDALWAVHSFHKVLASEIQRRLDRGHLVLEDEVAVDYGGLARRAKPGQNAPHLYRIEVRHPDTVDVSLLIPAQAELPTADTAELPQS
jgi:hypothetical protein